MGKSARSLDLDEERSSPLIEALGAVGGALARNPTLVGGTTAFLVALSFVSANAIWYQPHFHSGAFFATRDVDYVGPADPSQQETTIKIEREGDGLLDVWFAREKRGFESGRQRHHLGRFLAGQARELHHVERRHRRGGFGARL